MKLSYFLFLLVLLSCKDDNQKRDADNERRQVIFRISIKGFFMIRLLMKLPATVTTWTELRLFIAELAQNQKNHWCFPAKSTAISKSNGVDDKYPSSILCLK
jgi:hypothetical protein